MALKRPFVNLRQSGYKFTDMRFKPFHEAEGDALGKYPDAVEDADIDGIGNAGEEGAERERRISGGQDDAAGSEVQCRGDSILKVSKILPADRNADADEFILRVLCEVLDPLHRLPETPGHLRHPVMEGWVRSPEFYLKERTSGMNNPLEQIPVRKCPSVGEKFDPPVSVFPGSLEDGNDIGTDCGFAAGECNAVSVPLPDRRGYRREILLRRSFLFWGTMEA